MLVDRILYPITALGPGKRLVLWTVGCGKRCVQCANPELQKIDLSKNVELELIEKMIGSISGKIEGFTISGGEPLYQADELLRLMEFMRSISKDILLFTGYSIREIEEKRDVHIKTCIKLASVVIAGEYIDRLNDNTTGLVASSNQEIIFQDKQFRKAYEDYISRGRTIQNVFFDNHMMSVGIHNTRRTI